MPTHAFRFALWRAIILAVSASCGSFAIAQETGDTVEPPPWPEFNFRRVTVPGANHQGPRINIQIEPEDTVAIEPTAPRSPDAGTTEGGHVAWFWSEISPSLPADPSRFWDAQRLLSLAPEAPSLNVPRLATLNSIAEAHGSDILRATIGTQISPALVLAVMSVESSGRSDAVSSAGAQGLMQLIPATAERFGVTDPFDTSQNIAGGVAYLDWLMGEFGRDPVLVLAAYNAGEGAVTRSGGVPNYQETRTYVPKVLAAWEVARRLCRTPPELISDGCVFQPMAVN